MKTALNVGHWFSGKSKEEFIKDAKPYIGIAASLLKTVEKITQVKF